MNDTQENSIAMIIASVSLGVASIAADNEWYFIAISSALVFVVMIVTALESNNDDNDPDCLGI